jgi:putative tryptophan/tyrosine transport system substrate-binding protein
MQARSGRLSRRAFVGGLAGLGASTAGVLLLAACGATLPWTERQARLPRVGYLTGAAAGDSTTEAFRQGLQALGYVEGRDITVDYRYTEGRPERLPGLLAELLALQPNVLVTWGTSQTAAAKSATTTIPIVFQAGDPVRSGLVRTLARPGGNVTGVSLGGLELYGKRLELLTETLPGISRPVYLTDPAIATRQEIQDQASSLKIDTHVIEVSGPDDLLDAFAMALAHRADALALADPPWLFTNRSKAIGFAAQQGLPAIYVRREYVADGGLMSYGQNMRNSVRRVPIYVDKILKGANPGEIPVEQPTTFDFVVNRATHAHLGLTIPPDVAAQVTEWVQ